MTVLSVCLVVLGKQEVQCDAHQSGKGNPGEAEGDFRPHGKGEGSPTDADDEDHTADREVALVLVVDACLDHGA